MQQSTSSRYAGDHVTPALKEYTGYQLSRQSLTRSVYLCTVFTSEYLTDCVSTVLFPQPAADTGWGRLTLWTILPRTRTAFGERGFCYSGSDSLPSELRDISDTDTFKNGSGVYLSMVLISDSSAVFVNVSYSSALQISYWTCIWTCKISQ